MAALGSAAALLMLAGCSGGDTDIEPSSSQTPTSAQPTLTQSVEGSITVLAAASLTDVFTALGKSFEDANPGTTVTFSFGASSALATQVLEGAPADVLATANESTMQQVVDGGKVASAAAIFVQNTLEIAVPKGNPAGISSLADLAKPDVLVALCAPEVPCGSAAQKLLELAGVSVTPTTLESDVRAALTKVQLGEVDAALVYKTDVAAGGPDIEGIEIPEAAQVVNSYPIVALNASENPDLAAAFVAYILGPDAAAVFEEAGFDRP
jgi:molybdate transport system substrate-binding protein